MSIQVFDKKPTSVSEHKNYADPLAVRRLLFNLSVQQEVLNSRPYKGFWYVVTVTPKGNRRDPLFLYEHLFRSIPQCKSIRYMLLVRERSTQGVDHLHGVFHSKSKSKFLKLMKSSYLSFLISPIYMSYDYQDWFNYILKDRPPWFTIYRDRKFRILRFRDWKKNIV